MGTTTVTMISICGSRPLAERTSTLPVRTVPRNAPSAPTGAAWTAANASSRPSPQMLLSAAVPPQCVSSTSIAVRSSSCRVEAMSPCRAGEADHISATVAATCGLAMDVPEKTSYPPGMDERTLTPGAARFGLISPFSPEPRVEKLAMALLTSNAPAL
ncbi:hypothetical protein FHR32_008376 [Streptosporangium album]|uniref:Uncharacterized protein n=1 Tax=Streptosporangium album TaxID=47479 RepID=A0A7W7S4Z3_9ACTN|nr:hypothetical protein [Streptosporangium album]